MPDSGFGTVLTVLRIIRGMNQEELAHAAGLRSSVEW
jgi:DNA-binding XRE family transcriptional regulator